MGPFHKLHPPVYLATSDIWSWSAPDGLQTLALFIDTGVDTSFMGQELVKQVGLGLDSGSSLGT